MIYLLAFLAMTTLDVAWVGYNRTVARGHRAHARLWAVLLVALGGLNTLAIVSDPWALFATAAGAFFGTDLGLRLAERLERDDPDAPIPYRLAEPPERAGSIPKIPCSPTTRHSRPSTTCTPECGTGPDRRIALGLAINDVSQEIMSARGKFGAFHSAHEGFAVALEEVDELWEHVKRKQGERDLDAMRHEAIQAAAMFAAFAAECCGEKSGRV